MPLNNVDKQKIHYILKKVNHPARYVGNEVNSYNKSFENSSVTVALAFPDLYEIGISNFGLKIIYNIINNHKNFMADRVYAPDKDFKDELIKNNIDLYGLETFAPLRKFDILAFSLQYELNYTTMLSMLDMSKIPLYASKRDNNNPLIIVGGPSCFNPEPFANFVDAIVIGDGEDVIIEILSTIDKLKINNIIDRHEKLKALSMIQGVYIPSFYELLPNQELIPLSCDYPKTVIKRTTNLKKENCPTKYPLSSINAVHNRAVVEIRRGCGRMCRFCQPCFVNLPVRELSANDIIDLCEQSLTNSGYDEYSLLSLSTCDYKGIENLAINLNNKFAPKNISISLPSQRADNFNINLARQIQAVRKSTLTFAPEAGTERLRQVINKNLTQEDILNAALSAYQAGWYKIKFYFIIGLPTETYEDLDGIIELLKLIKQESNKLRGQNSQIKMPLDIVCSISLFISKPFTPFQWFGQLTTEEINSRKNYLINKARGIKGLKLNFHDTFSSKLEALFSKGNRELGKLIHNAYLNGSYLDSWTEYFSKELWEKSLADSNISIETLTTLNFKDTDILPWEIINVGLDKEWLLHEKNLSLQSINNNTCENSCTNCGVCVNLKLKPQLKSHNNDNFIVTNEVQENPGLSNSKFKYRLKISKENDLRYISHLDWFRLLYRALKKLDLPIAFSKGFNPSPKISLGLSLGLFQESISEYMDIVLTEQIEQTYIEKSLNYILPDDTQVLNIKQIDNQIQSISQSVYWAEYEALPESGGLNFIEIENSINNLLNQDELIINKKSKHKTRLIDVKPLINSLKIINSQTQKLSFTISVQPEKTLRADELLNLFSNTQDWKIKRVKLMDKEFKEL